MQRGYQKIRTSNKLTINLGKRTNTQNAHVSLYTTSISTGEIQILDKLFEANHKYTSALFMDTQWQLFVGVLQNSCS